MDAHRLAELRSIAMHTAIADKLVDDPSILERARARIDQWAELGAIHPAYAERWRHILSLPLCELRDRLVSDDEPMRALRQSTPFVGALGARERWAVRRSVREST